MSNLESIKENLKEICVKQEPLESDDKFPNVNGVICSSQDETHKWSEDSHLATTRVKIEEIVYREKIEVYIEEKTENNYLRNIKIEDDNLKNDLVNEDLQDSSSQRLKILRHIITKRKKNCKNIEEDFPICEERLADDGSSIVSSSLATSNSVEGEVERISIEGNSPLCPRSSSTERISFLYPQVSINPESNTFNCTFCNYRTNVKGNFQRHLLIHSKIKLFQCAECDYACNQKTSLQAHILIHSDRKYFKCSECSYETKWKKDLQRHVLVHSNIKMFKCPQCSYECNQKCNLKTHSLTHSGTKVFKCFDCDYECKRKGNLKEHVLTHTDTKMFKCSECAYGTNWKKDLTKHKLTHTNIKLFKCAECKYGTNWKKDLRKHLMIHARNSGLQLPADAAAGAKKAAMSRKAATRKKTIAEAATSEATVAAAIAAVAEAAARATAVATATNTFKTSDASKILFQNSQFGGPHEGNNSSEEVARIGR